MVNTIHIGFLHPSQELTSIRTQTLHIPTLTFGVQGVESQRRLTAAGNTGHNGYLLLGNVQGDVFQIVRARTDNIDGTGRHRYKLSAYELLAELLNQQTGLYIGGVRETLVQNGNPNGCANQNVAG